MTVYDVLVSLWRTAVPIIVGWVGALLAHIYIDVDEQALSQSLAAVFAVVYYGLFRLLEAKVSPAFGWLLGLARPPAYTKPDPTVTPWGKPPAT
ncbi:hypothetical protein [Streptomyces sp. NBC_01451]|uniref:hypothetical protein n=1 Tax=Streptomyces sp. NBC_01451 TaxID=2903872 RepID=UPI002E3315A1|nr:hypothetical protein [Streptomyces sp. NBC_01451]